MNHIRTLYDRREFVERLAAIPLFGALTSAQGVSKNRTRLILLGTKGGPRVTPEGSRNCSVVLLINGVPYVVDCGYGTSHQLLAAKIPLETVRYLFITHHHSDHTLNFHLGKMTPEEAVALLVEKVGHERENALAEVRRSFGGDYGPLYQMAYMMGGLQFYTLHRDLVASKKMTNQQFHDAILKEGPIPVEMVRAILTNQKLSRDYKPNWKYYEVGE